MLNDQPKKFRGFFRYALALGLLNHSIDMFELVIGSFYHLQVVGSPGVGEDQPGAFLRIVDCV
jgi:hypothetical protein